MTHEKEDATENARKQARAQAESITAMVAALELDYNEDAKTRIYEDALSVEVRSGWQNAGEALEADEFAILLCTGGPAVRIRGELDQHKQPCRAWLEYQDWFTPWTEYHGEGVSEDDLLTYCGQFYFGE